MASPLLLLVHGRSGGLVPQDLQQLAQELEVKRRAPVRLLALTAPQPPDQELVALARAMGTPLSLVPLMLLPGNHVRFDLPVLAAQWRLHGPVRRVPFLGAWPAWQQALVEELRAIGPDPVLLHHPVQAGVAVRYVEHLARLTGATCLATPYSDLNGFSDLKALDLVQRRPLLPLALAANRLTDSLSALVGRPLLERPRFHQLLMQQLEALP